MGENCISCIVKKFTFLALYHFKVDFAKMTLNFTKGNSHFTKVKIYFANSNINFAQITFNFSKVEYKIASETKVNFEDMKYISHLSYLLEKRLL